MVKSRQSSVNEESDSDETILSVVQSKFHTIFQNGLNNLNDSTTLSLPTWFPKTITEEQALGVGVGLSFVTIAAAISFISYASSSTSGHQPGDSSSSSTAGNNVKSRSVFSLSASTKSPSVRQVNHTFVKNVNELHLILVKWGEINRQKARFHDSKSTEVKHLLEASEKLSNQTSAHTSDGGSLLAVSHIRLKMSRLCKALHVALNTLASGTHHIYVNDELTVLKKKWNYNAPLDVVARTKNNDSNNPAGGTTKQTPTRNRKGSFLQIQLDRAEVKKYFSEGKRAYHETTRLDATWRKKYKRSGAGLQSPMSSSTLSSTDNNTSATDEMKERRSEEIRREKKKFSEAMAILQGYDLAIYNWSNALEKLSAAGAGRVAARTAAASEGTQSETTVISNSDKNEKDSTLETAKQSADATNNTPIPLIPTTSYLPEILFITVNRAAAIYRMEKLLSEIRDYTNLTLDDLPELELKKIMKSNETIDLVGMCACLHLHIIDDCSKAISAFVQLLLQKRRGRGTKKDNSGEGQLTVWSAKDWTNVAASLDNNALGMEDASLVDSLVTGLSSKELFGMTEMIEHSEDIAKVASQDSCPDVVLNKASLEAEKYLGRVIKSFPSAVSGILIA
eukprot:g1404.t1